MVRIRDNSSSNESLKETKQQWLYSQIKTAIINNEYLPGTMLTERALCDKYDVSRTPIREALRQLANEGMIQHIIGKGAFVAEVSFENMIEIFEMREALERQAVKLFILKDDGTLALELEKCFEEQMTYENTDPVKFMEKDMEFHFLLAEGAKNKRLLYALETIYDQIEMMAISAENDENLRLMARRHHQHVLEAVREKNVELGEKYIVEHILEVKKYHMSKYMISS
jgi:DNA-binding GntR family transcriptional regulator